jgi:YfiH family protein
MSFILPAETPTGITIALSSAHGGLDFSRSADNSAAYAAVKEQFGIKNIITLKQIHSALIKETDLSNAEKICGSEADGVWTQETDLALGILTADCYPVFLAGKRTICALHCGWRGTLSGIIKNAETFFSKANDRPEYAYIGAGISAGKFSVKEDFISRLSESEKIYLFQDAGTAYFDLLKKIYDDISAIGVERIASCGACTASDPDFYSHRRDKTDKRMLSFIVRRGVS